MRVVCPFTPDRLAAATRAALPAHTEYVEMTAFDSYQRLLRSLWDRGESFVIVEHDVVPALGALDDLMACDAEWCGCPYPPADAVPLGCVKIADTLIAKLPGLWERMPLRHWQYCDSWFGAHAEAITAPHPHQPVTHLHQDNPIVPKGPLQVRVRRQYADMIEIAYYDPLIEYEFGSVTMPLEQLSGAAIAADLERLTIV